MRNAVTALGDPVTTNGVVGPTHGSSSSVVNIFTVQVVRTAGTTDAVDVDLEGSLDGTTFFKLGDVVTSVAGGTAAGFVVDRPVPFWRYRVVVVGSGNTLRVHICAMAP
jgi:hypothetical protein